MRVAIPALALCALAVWGAAGEKASPPPPVFPVGLDLVNLTVTVRDAEGNLVSNLKAEDFTVLEDGHPQALQLFAPAVDPGQEETLALDLGLLMDTSESMLNEMRLSQEAAVRFLEAIPRARDLMTIFFDQDIRISRYDSEHQQGLFARILEMKGSGNTALYDAIAVYLSRVQNSSGRRVLVLFTDGDDTTSSLSLPETIELVRSSAVTIYSIAFRGAYPTGSSQGLAARAFLHQIADLSGGDVFTPVSSKDLDGIYDKILAALTSQYVLGYVSDNPHRDGKFRKLKVEVRPKGMKVRYRGGYYAPKDG